MKTILSYFTILALTVSAFAGETVVNSRPAAYLARALYYVLPNLESFDIKALVVHGQPVAPGYVLMTVGYAIVYTAVLLVGAMTIFSRRDFK